MKTQKQIIKRLSTVGILIIVVSLPAVRASESPDCYGTFPAPCHAAKGLLFWCEPLNGNQQGETDSEGSATVNECSSDANDNATCTYVGTVNCTWSHTVVECSGNSTVTPESANTVTYTCPNS
jgi:hypothetical protein